MQFIGKDMCGQTECLLIISILFRQSVEFRYFAIWAQCMPLFKVFFTEKHLKDMRLKCAVYLNWLGHHSGKVMILGSYPPVGPPLNFSFQIHYNLRRPQT